MPIQTYGTIFQGERIATFHYFGKWKCLTNAPFSSYGTHKIITKVLYFLSIWQKLGRIFICSHQVAIVLAATISFIWQSRERRSVPLPKQSGIACFKNSCNTPVENRHPRGKHCHSWNHLLICVANSVEFTGTGHRTIKVQLTLSFFCNIVDDPCSYPVFLHSFVDNLLPKSNNRRMIEERNSKLGYWDKGV